MSRPSHLPAEGATKKSQGLFATLLITLIVAVGIGGYLYWDQNIKEIPTTDTANSENRADTPVTTSEPVATSEELSSDLAATQTDLDNIDAEIKNVDSGLDDTATNLDY